MIVKKMTCTVINDLYDNVLNTIEASVGYANKGKNRNMVTLYWRIGKLISDALHPKSSQEVLGSTTKAISKKLIPVYGKDYSEKALKQMVKFSERFDYADVVDMSKVLQWEHFEKLADIDNDQKRNFYAWMSVSKNWAAGSLKSKISSDLYRKFSQIQAPKDDKSSLIEDIIAETSRLKSILGLNSN